MEQDSIVGRIRQGFAPEDWDKISIMRHTAEMGTKRLALERRRKATYHASRSVALKVVGICFLWIPT